MTSLIKKYRHHIMNITICICVLLLMSCIIISMLVGFPIIYNSEEVGVISKSSMYISHIGCSMFTFLALLEALPGSSTQ